jgi:hypothetical protein
MSSVGKPVKVIKQKTKAAPEDQTRALKTEKQSEREIAKVVSSWIEEQKQIRKERRDAKLFELQIID